jgi:hypothetical protein
MSDPTATCSIVLRGPIDESWADYFGDLVLEAQVRDAHIEVTMLSGPVLDFAAFIGLIIRIHNLGLTVRSVHYQAPATPSWRPPQPLEGRTV